MKQLLMSAAAIAALVTLGNGAAQAQEPLDLALVPKNVNNPFFDQARDGCMKAQEELKGQIECRYIGPGEMFGAVAALMGRPFPAEAVAVLDSQEIYWPTPVFRELMARHPRWAESAAPLQMQLFNSTDAQTEFFHHLSALKGEDTELREIYWYALALGFKRQYYFEREHGDGEIAKLIALHAAQLPLAPIDARTLRDGPLVPQQDLDAQLVPVAPAHQGQAVGHGDPLERPEEVVVRLDPLRRRRRFLEQLVADVLQGDDHERVPERLAEGGRLVRFRVRGRLQLGLADDARADGETHQARTGHGRTAIRLGGLRVRPRAVGVRRAEVLLAQAEGVVGRHAVVAGGPQAHDRELRVRIVNDRHNV